MNSGQSQDAVAVRNPFLVPSFWLLIFNTIIMKWQHNRRSDARYTDHLHRFYTRTYTPHVESYGDAYAEIRPALVALSGVQPGDRVLDVATGGGYQAAAFAAAGCRVTGMDVVVDRARLASEQHTGPALAFGTSDASRLPFADGTFDVVSISLALHDMPLDVQMNALREMARVSRGRVVIVEPRCTQHRLGSWLYIHLGAIIDESMHWIEYMRRDFDAHLMQAGLRIASTHRIFHNLLTIFVCEPGEG